MRKLKIGGALAGIAIAALALTACNSGTPGATEPTDGGGDEETSSTPWEVATDVSLGVGTPSALAPAVRNADPPMISAAPSVSNGASERVRIGCAVMP